MEDDELRQGGSSLFTGSEDYYYNYGGGAGISSSQPAKKSQFDFRDTFMSYFSYSTARLVKVHSLRVAVIFRIFQLVIILYIIG